MQYKCLWIPYVWSAGFFSTFKRWAFSGVDLKFWAEPIIGQYVGSFFASDRDTPAWKIGGGRKIDFSRI